MLLINGEKVSEFGLLKGRGGNPLNLGTKATTGHGLGAGDVLIGGKLEVDSTVHLDGILETYDAVNFRKVSPTAVQFRGGANVVIHDDTALQFGSVSDVKMEWETADPNANELIIALPDGGAINVPVLVIGDQGIIDANLGFFDGETIPRLAMIAADEGGYFAWGVDDTDILDIIATTSPEAETDETKFSDKLECVINGTTYYIMLTQT